MKKISIDTYSKKVKGCFTGKTVGGTLGMPLEGYIGVKKVEYYDPIPTEMIANDDLDIQVIWMETIKRFGLPVNRNILCNAFKEHNSFLVDEYAVSISNRENGLNAPISGYYNNKFRNGMGAAIRSEIWACLAPGDPKLAAKLAREDACIDHSDEGVDAAVFIAAIESAAFVEQDYWKLVEIGLSLINSDGKFHKAISYVMQCVREGKDILEIRELVLKKFFHQNWTDVCINFSFMIAVFLTCGGDVSKGLCTIASLGHDADCTCATLGSIFGILNPDGFEKRWTDPLGDKLVISAGICALHPVNTLTEFTDEIIELSPEVLDFYNSSTVIEGAENKNCLLKWAKTDKNLSLEESFNCLESIVSVSPITVKLYYPKNVSIAPAKTECFKAKFLNPMGNRTSAKVRLVVPNGWNVEPKDFKIDISGQDETEIEFAVTAPNCFDIRSCKNPLDIHITTDTYSYSVSAGLIQTIDFINAPLEHLDDISGKNVINGNVNTVNAHANYFEFDNKQQLFATEFRAPHYIAETIMAAQSTNAMKIWIDGELVLEHDGGEYVPAYHRSEYVKTICLDKKWHRLTLWIDDKPFGEGNQELNPHNAIVNVEGTMSTPEYRKSYETFKNNGKGELYIGFAFRSGYRLINNMEWRLPKDNKFF